MSSDTAFTVTFVSVIALIVFLVFTISSCHLTAYKECLKAEQTDCIRIIQ